ncbi:hypothetical protein PENARI_c001G03098 [Penicillium arizonense]|uniref:Phosphoglycerate mutase family protein n=1 Tax=Penicillium arizonense TaxID=1835702 RepID=A0A1F5LXU9_PENAI|nr:hypothetical protein PENARI_c001G03098 [Penicillium arizonense]OGE57761.1 hypothetical protein PENARI_c001G03098 [Penicillium arizonense]
MLLQLVLMALCLVLGIVSAQNPTVYIIRHGEKPANKDDHGLILDGIKRAQCLRSVFGEGSGYNIGHIMAPHRKKVECVAETVRSYDGPGNILIAWRHTNMGGIEEALGAYEPIEYPDDRFDLIWTDPWPYGNVTQVESEGCPGLDTDRLVDQS